MRSRPTDKVIIVPTKTQQQQRVSKGSNRRDRRNHRRGGQFDYTPTASTPNTVINEPEEHHIDNTPESGARSILWKTVTTKINGKKVIFSNKMQPDGVNQVKADTVWNDFALKLTAPQDEDPQAWIGWRAYFDNEVLQTQIVSKVFAEMLEENRLPLNKDGSPNQDVLAMCSHAVTKRSPRHLHHKHHPHHDHVCRKCSTLSSEGHEVSNTHYFLCSLDALTRVFQELSTKNFLGSKNLSRSLHLSENPMFAKQTPFPLMGGVPYQHNPASHSDWKIAGFYPAYPKPFDEIFDSDNAPISSALAVLNACEHAYRGTTKVESGGKHLAYWAGDDRDKHMRNKYISELLQQPSSKVPTIVSPLIEDKQFLATWGQCSALYAWVNEHRPYRSDLLAGERSYPEFSLTQNPSTMNNKSFNIPEINIKRNSSVPEVTESVSGLYLNAHTDMVVGLYRENLLDDAFADLNNHAEALAKHINPSMQIKIMNAEQYQYSHAIQSSLKPVLGCIGLVGEYANHISLASKTIEHNAENDNRKHPTGEQRAQNLLDNYGASMSLLSKLALPLAKITTSKYAAKNDITNAHINEHLQYIDSLMVQNFFLHNPSPEQEYMGSDKPKPASLLAKLNEDPDCRAYIAARQKTKCWDATLDKNFDAEFPQNRVGDMYRNILKDWYEEY